MLNQLQEELKIAMKKDMSFTFSARHSGLIGLVRNMVGIPKTDSDGPGSGTRIGWEGVNYENSLTQGFYGKLMSYIYSRSVFLDKDDPFASLVGD